MEKVKQQIPFKKQQIHIFLLTLFSVLSAPPGSIHRQPHSHTHTVRLDSLHKKWICATVLHFSSILCVFCFFFISLFARSFQFNFKLFCYLDCIRLLLVFTISFLLLGIHLNSILCVCRNRCRKWFAWASKPELELKLDYNYGHGRLAIWMMMMMMTWLLIKNARTQYVFVYVCVVGKANEWGAQTLSNHSIKFSSTDAMLS